MAGATLQFEFDDREREAEFLVAYLADAWDRFESADWFDTGWFWRYGQFDEYDVDYGPSVELVLEGNPDELLEAERGRWATLQEDRILESWTLERYEPEFESLLAQQRDAKGEVGGELDYRLKPLTSRFALEMAQAFEGERVPPVGRESEANPTPIGVWVVVHYVMLQNGYDWYDEIDAASKAIRNRCRSLSHYGGSERALDALREVVDDLEEIADDLESGTEPT
ncbi:hypothetical protein CHINAEXTREME_01905 [Halobiforma lacisalsi AJ5]|uniref:Uncharacterized protein n=1 Tax=Natronobacterium lacisalsi AJ5 TaxID=358396 RepID=M0LI72_NATLA|nr:hypothetical protein [Halobiforma lacisalsi]APW96599.1 hypothetical protein CHINAEXTREME_01905 [Halobiforma lacisalsi AJ5]EMA32119.1 hypothetical protein C445_12431 [Halobiforma lacisalsi AJ5]